jgi:diguanylate cyclase (GGDEF)-like protein/PAS domain S-box-containing protein
MTDPGSQPPGDRATSFWAPFFVQLANATTLGIVISSPDGQITRTNPALREILGCAEDELVGRALSELFAPEHQLAVQHVCRLLQSGHQPWFRAELQLQRKDGETVHAQLTVSALRDAGQQLCCLVAMVHDVTELHLVNERLNHQALHDVRTGLPNRQYFVSHLEEVLGRSEPSAVVTLLHLNLGGFSVINDGLGHHYGDQVLDLVARRLEFVVADQQAMVARIAGDEYAILLQPGNRVPDVGALVERVNTELSKTVDRDLVAVSVTARIGAVQRQAGTTTPTELMRAASATLRRARESGTRWALFDPESAAADRAELQLAARMPEAIDDGQLRVHYQPVAALDTGRPVAVEAILSWYHPALGALSHDRCVQLAERTGAAHAVGRYLLSTAAEQTAWWRRRSGERVSPTVVNLSHYQAQDPGLGTQISALLEQTGLPADALELGLPATTLRSADSAPGAVVKANLHHLAELGVRMALYDFGGDLRELSCVAELGITRLRISGAVAERMADNPSPVTAHSTRALVAALHAAGISVVACPVDTRESATWWHEAGARYGVGALFGRPGPPPQAVQPNPGRSASH